MKRFLTILSFLILFCGVSFFVIQPFKSNEDPPEFADVNYKLEPLKCDLNLESCSVDFDGNLVEFSLSPKPVYAMKTTQISIFGLEKLNINLPRMKFYGINMNMGDVFVDLKKKNNEYVGEFVLSTCFLESMRYRFEIFDADKSTGIFIDFDLKR